MAQLVNYDVEYTEGPFVLVNAGGYRVEVELKEHYCPVLPDSSIYMLLEKNRKYVGGKSYDRKKVEEVVDLQVENGVIFLQNGCWVTKIEEIC